MAFSAETGSLIWFKPLPCLLCVGRDMGIYNYMHNKQTLAFVLPTPYYVFRGFIRTCLPLYALMFSLDANRDKEQRRPAYTEPTAHYKSIGKATEYGNSSTTLPTSLGPGVGPDAVIIYPRAK